MAKHFPRAIVLAGGKSSRFGTDKAVADIGGITLTAFCVQNLLTVFDKVLVVAKNPLGLGLEPNCRVQLVKDEYPQYASLVGILSGLKASDRTLNYVVGCDMPAVVPSLITALHDLVRRRDCAFRQDESGIPQPLGAYYSKRMLPMIEKYANNEEFRLTALSKNTDSIALPFESVKKLDPDLASFRNINTQVDFEQIKNALEATNLESIR